ncbi:SDR family oxidoreductase [Jatrophihabitans sp.]|uniref:SDR family NAD(P)-dependent oxidoreductase n=1 Tax=Jatrophihabitans sp. TaxID=1932789 RepID=UPI0030C6F248|nr:putative oxidoreductase [Jatrophihabitans sp.]
MSGYDVPAMFNLDGNVAIVTGASSGLGVAFAVGLAQAGAQVVLAARRADQLATVSNRIREAGGRCLTVPTDITDPVQCTQLIARAKAEYGRVDILVNNAGVGAGGPALHDTPEQFSHVIDVNLKGTYWMAQAFARAADDGGVVVNVSSILALTTARLPHAAYSASKAAIIGLTQDLAAQWSGRRNIRVNALAPGFFPSEMSDQYPDGYLARMADERTMLGRLGRVEELAATLVWLVSPAAGYVTGQTIVVDGGAVLT